MTQKQIVRVFSMYRHSIVEAQLLKAYLEEHQSRSDDGKKLRRLEQLKRIADSWLQLVNPDEAFVLSRHLIDQLDWPHLAEEDKIKWGLELARSERTLKRVQARALEKLEVFSGSTAEDMNLYLLGLDGAKFDG